MGYTALLALGLAMIWLAATGRLESVWNALKGGGGSSGGKGGR